MSLSNGELKDFRFFNLNSRLFTIIVFTVKIFHYLPISSIAIYFSQF